MSSWTWPSPNASAARTEPAGAVEFSHNSVGNSILKIGINSFASGTLKELVSDIQQAESEGFATVTVPNIFGFDAIVALAVAWANKAASSLIGRGKLKRKTHGYYAKSWFRTGFDEIRRLLRSDPRTALKPWSRIRKRPGVV